MDTVFISPDMQDLKFENQKSRIQFDMIDLSPFKKKTFAEKEAEKND